MPYALSTTKRKFHRILDSISNASSPSLVLKDQINASTATFTSLESPAKKPRFMHHPVALLESTTLNTANQISSIRNGDSTTRRHSTSLTNMSNEERKPPNFAPWDRTQFLERLKTFRHVATWMSKPDKVNEVQWARRGWSCVEKERVGCVGGCGNEIVVKLEDYSLADWEKSDKASEDRDEDQEEWREGAREELINKYVDIIVAGHDEQCLWRRRGCDDAIYRLPLAHQVTALNSLRLRYESLLAMSADLPSSVSIPESFTLSPTSTQLFSLLYPSPDTPQLDSSTTITPINNEALILAIFGWQAEPSFIPTVATCHACFRRLGLWLFKPSGSASPVLCRLDAAEEHRHYCPWVNPESQTPTPTHDQKNLSKPSNSDQAGWEILVRVINSSSARAERRSLSVTTDTTTATAVNGDGLSELGSVLSRTETGGTDVRDARDKERWAKLKKLKQVFHVKRGKGKGAAEKEKEREKRRMTGMENFRVSSVLGSLG